MARYAVIQRALMERHLWVEAESPSEAVRLLRDDGTAGEIDALDAGDFRTVKLTYRRDPSQDEEPAP